MEIITDGKLRERVEVPKNLDDWMDTLDLYGKLKLLCLGACQGSEDLSGNKLHELSTWFRNKMMLVLKELNFDNRVVKSAKVPTWNKELSLNTYIKLIEYGMKSIIMFLPRINNRI